MTIKGCVALVLMLSWGAVEGTSAFGASPFDGSYNGTYARVSDSSNGQRCPTGGDLKQLTVANGMLRWRVGSDVTLVKIKDDGSFSEQSGAAFLTGQITNGSLTAKLTRGSCGYGWSATR